MNPAIPALLRAAITFTSDLLVAGNDATAIRLIREFQARIEAALAAVEVRT
jgi:hypothetical protein